MLYVFLVVCVWISIPLDLSSRPCIPPPRFIHSRRPTTLCACNTFDYDVCGDHLQTPATGKERGDLEIKLEDYVVLQKPQEQADRLPPPRTFLTSR